MSDTRSKQIILASLRQSKLKEQDFIQRLHKQIKERESVIDVLNIEIKRMEFIIEQGCNGISLPPIEYAQSLTWAEKIAYILSNHPDGLTTPEIAKELRSLDDELLLWDNPTLAARISAIVGVNRGNRFERNGKVIKLKKAELTAS